MHIEQRRYLREINNCRSMNKAGENLHISHQAIAAAIRSLEQELNIQLLERNPRGASLALAGWIFPRIFCMILTPSEHFKEYNFCLASTEALYWQASDEHAIGMVIDNGHGTKGNKRIPFEPMAYFEVCAVRKKYTAAENAVYSSAAFHIYSALQLRESKLQAIALICSLWRL